MLWFKIPEILQTISYTTQHGFVKKKNQRFLFNFGALSPSLLDIFFPAR
jgi:hypothetical protein